MSRLYPCVYYTEDGHCKKYSDDEVTSWCIQGPCEYETPSNADRIRMMTDEELAEWMNDGWLDVAISKSMVSTEQWLDWLRKEADEKTIRKTEENADCRKNFKNAKSASNTINQKYGGANERIQI